MLQEYNTNIRRWMCSDVWCVEFMYVKLFGYMFGYLCPYHSSLSTGRWRRWVWWVLHVDDVYESYMLHVEFMKKELFGYMFGYLCPYHSSLSTSRWRRWVWCHSTWQLWLELNGLFLYLHNRTIIQEFCDQRIIFPVLMHLVCLSEKAQSCETPSIPPAQQKGHQTKTRN